MIAGAVDLRCVLQLVRLVRNVAIYTGLEQIKEVWAELEEGI